MRKSPHAYLHLSHSLFRLTKTTPHRFAACAALMLLASLHPFANAAQYGNDPLGQVYTHDGGGYVYDANQNQTFQYVKAPGSTTPTVAYAAFPGLEIEYRLDGSGNLTRQALRRHIGSERKTVTGPSDDAMVESDVLGNVAMVRHGVNIAFANYTPFGQMIQSRSSGFGNEWYGYKGGRIDQTGTGLYRFGARSYDPNSSWTSRDPIRNQLAASDAYAAFNENPIVFDDPSGLQSMPGNAIEHPAPTPPADVAAAVRQFCQASPSECINGIPNSSARAAYYTQHGQLPAITPLAGQNGRLQPGSGITPIAAPSHIEALPSRPEIGVAAGATLFAEGTGAAIVRFGSRALPYLNAARAAAARQVAATFFSAGSTTAGAGPAAAAPNHNSTGLGSVAMSAAPTVPPPSGGGNDGSGGGASGGFEPVRFRYLPPATGMSVYRNYVPQTGPLPLVWPSQTQEAAFARLRGGYVSLHPQLQSAINSGYNRLSESQQDRANAIDMGTALSEELRRMGYTDDEMRGRTAFHIWIGSTGENVLFPPNALDNVVSGVVWQQLREAGELLGVPIGRQ